jgi:hypothetical protein
MRRFLARLRAGSYLGLLGAVAACARPGPVVPTDAFVPSDRRALEAFAATSRPTVHIVARFRWRFEDQRLRVSGNGAVRVAPPDTLRADIGAAFGLARSTVVLAGDGVDARPADVVERLLPDRFALWAALGVVRAPPGPLVVARREAGPQVLWRVSDADGRVTIFETAEGRLVSVTREEGGRATTVLALTHSDSDGTVRRARLTDYVRSARLDIEITSREHADPFPPETWRLGP